VHIVEANHLSVPAPYNPVIPSVLAMRKHLPTLPAYAHFFTELSAYCRNEYQQTIRENLIPSFRDLLQPQQVSAEISVS